MAARTGAGTGVVVGLVVFVLSTIFLLVLTIVFYARATEAQESLKAARDDLNEFADRTLRSAERGQTIKAQAKQANKSALKYLLDQRDSMATKVVGNPNATMEDFESELAKHNAGNANATYRSTLESMSGDLRGARMQIEGLNGRITQQDDLINAQKALIEQAAESRKKEVREVLETLASFMQDVQKYGLSVNEARGEFLNILNDLENKFNGEVDQLENELDIIRGELALKDAQLADYIEAIAEIRKIGKDPSALVDGTILDNSDSQGRVFIDKGRRDHIALGMTFEVYDDAALLTPLGDGSMQRGKASIQVIDVAETTSTAKITRGSTAKPVVRGDVIANAVYDPKKKFSFLVHGKFDVNGDGRPSETEADFVRGLIKEWGGKVIDGDELRGDMDFLLLGVQPIKPPRLRDGATGAEIDIWVKQNKADEKYRKLMSDAQKAYIPVLNQNRFFILTGHTNN